MSMRLIISLFYPYFFPIQKKADGLAAKVNMFRITVVFVPDIRTLPAELHRLLQSTVSMDVAAREHGARWALTAGSPIDQTEGV